MSKRVNERIITIDVYRKWIIILSIYKPTDNRRNQKKKNSSKFYKNETWTEGNEKEINTFNKNGEQIMEICEINDVRIFSTVKLKYLAFTIKNGVRIYQH